MKVRYISVKKISVIVPVYNTENELSRCLKSIVNQTYPNLEIICIDDGSTDGSGQIIDGFAAQDERVKAIHKINGGESSARNAGLKMSTGEYFAFCDCDDWLEPDMYEVLVAILENEKVDLAAASWYKDFAGESQKIRNELPINSEIFGRTELLTYLYMRDSYRGFAYMWDKLYTREVLSDKQGNLILFDEELQLGGDVLYLAEAALNTKRAKYVDKAFYHYVQRAESGCHTKDTKKLYDSLRAYEMVIQRFEEEHIDQMIINYVKRFLAYHSSNAAEIAIAQGQRSAIEEFQTFMKKYEQEYVALNLQYPERIQRYKNLLNQ